MADKKRPRGRARTARKRKPAQPRRDHPAHPAARHRLAWYLGLALMAAFEVIEWPVAIAIGVGHEIAHRARTRALRDFAEGVEAGG